MRFGDRSLADIKISLCFYASGVGGEEGQELAVGTINLRDIWTQKKDLKHQQVRFDQPAATAGSQMMPSKPHFDVCLQVVLFEEGLTENSSISVSSSVIQPLSALLQI